MSCDFSKSLFFSLTSTISGNWQLWTSGSGCSQEETWDEVPGMPGPLCDFHKWNVSIIARVIGWLKEVLKKAEATIILYELNIHL